MLQNLKILDLSYNSLNGAIPHNCEDLSNLQSLFLSHNYLTGTIPTEFGTLSNLVELDLDDNKLTGEIPQEIVNLSKLETFEAHFNNLTGNVDFLCNSTDSTKTKSIDWISVDCSQVTCSCCGRCNANCSGLNSNISNQNNSVVVRLDIRLDENPNETIWRIRQHLNNEIKTFGGGGSCASPNDLLQWRVDLKLNATIDFVIFDRGSNGICCDNGHGNYTISAEYPDGEELLESSYYSFGKVDRKKFTLDHLNR